MPELNDSIADKLLPGCTDLKQVFTTYELSTVGMIPIPTFTFTKMLLLHESAGQGVFIAKVSRSGASCQRPSNGQCNSRPALQGFDTKFLFFLFLKYLLDIMMFHQMVEIDIPQSMFEEQGRQLYGAKLLEIQVSIYKLSICVCMLSLHMCIFACICECAWLHQL